MFIAYVITFIKHVDVNSKRVYWISVLRQELVEDKLLHGYKCIVSAYHYFYSTLNIRCFQPSRMVETNLLEIRIIRIVEDIYYGIVIRTDKAYC